MAIEIELFAYGWINCANGVDDLVNEVIGADAPAEKSAVTAVALIVAPVEGGRDDDDIVLLRGVGPAFDEPAGEPHRGVALAERSMRDDQDLGVRSHPIGHILMILAVIRFLEEDFTTLTLER